MSLSSSQRGVLVTERTVGGEDEMRPKHDAKQHPPIVRHLALIPKVKIDHDAKWSHWERFWQAQVEAGERELKLIPDDHPLRPLMEQVVENSQRLALRPPQA